ncbi:NAD-dependent succinate-semialdehyde dehydrogenase [Catenovulum sp. SM1970]|uniref:NAD-dependent succinate-semialdehyde dehydrogenase n=1 Tax=Marinifaba aquimaris TaxID=2741323 RepID=UPI0015738484|nr:NAD-dependent succinate-semialdehyde dehydrogenase [Marinifaba aquimaris]NTS77362.1 NAD-dependent succinate-semialdehyde dehydrogenase [Marinifaba aquimaris]
MVKNRLIQNHIDSGLLHTHSFINGQWLDTGMDTLTVYSPIDQQPLINLSQVSESQITSAIESSVKAQQKWKKTPANSRREKLKKWLALIEKHKDDLAQIISLENGKPVSEALVEIDYGASYIDWFADQAIRIKGDILVNQNNQQIWLNKQAVGVVYAITPWNFPNAMITRKVAPALAAGCSIILKPSELTPLSAIALTTLADKAGIDPGVITLLISNHAEQVSQQIMADKRVRKVSFTGSTRVGKLLCQQAAKTMKRTSMELGGNAPFIVCDDADLDLAVDAAIAAKFRNAGQACVAANRFYLSQTIATTFTEKLVQKLKDLFENKTEQSLIIGPMITEQAKTKVLSWIEAAIAQGAKKVYTAKCRNDGQYLAPTVINNISSEMALFQNEIFAPVIAITHFDKLSDVIAQANNTDAGLAAYCFSQNLETITLLNNELEYGMVAINQGSLSNAIAPFGGIKDSGLGREGSDYGLDEYLDLKYTNLVI